MKKKPSQRSRDRDRDTMRPEYDFSRAAVKNKLGQDTNGASPQPHEHALTAKRWTVSSRGRKPTVGDP
jgi:hypothetical protein